MCARKKIRLNKNEGILQQSQNDSQPILTVLPITSSVGKVYPFEVFLKKGESSIDNDSKIKVNQIRTIDKMR